MLPPTGCCISSLGTAFHGDLPNVADYVFSGQSSVSRARFTELELCGISMLAVSASIWSAGDPRKT